MQNRYTGDIGDFGKFLLLKALFPEHTIGTVWYLYPDETHNNDGSHIVCDANHALFRRCMGLDPVMAESFNAIFRHPSRHVGLLESAKLIPDGVYFSEPVLGNDPNDLLHRPAWHAEALDHIAVHGCSVVCLDPDNGIEPRSKSKAAPSARGKYVTYDEIEAFFQIEAVRHCLIYQHPHRMKSHAAQARELHEEFSQRYHGRAAVTLIRHNPVQPRFYIVLSKEGPIPGIDDKLSSLLFGGKPFFSLMPQN